MAVPQLINGHVWIVLDYNYTYLSVLLWAGMGLGSLLCPWAWVPALAQSRYYMKIYQAFRILPPRQRIPLNLPDASSTLICSVTLQDQQVTWHYIYFTSA